MRALAALVATIGALLVPAGAASAQPAPPPELESQLEARSDGSVRIDRDPVTGAVTFVGTQTGDPITTPTESAGAPGDAADAFVDEFGPLFGATADAGLEQVNVVDRVGGGSAVV